MEGGFEPADLSAAGAMPGAAASGSAPDEGVLISDMTRQTATTAARHTTTTVRLTRDTVCSAGFGLQYWLVPRGELLRVRN